MATAHQRMHMLSTIRGPAVPLRSSAAYLKPLQSMVSNYGRLCLAYPLRPYTIMRGASIKRFDGPTTPLTEYQWPAGGMNGLNNLLLCLLYYHLGY